MLEPGKRADLAILDRDIVTGSADPIADAEDVGAFAGGKKVFKPAASPSTASQFSRVAR